MRTRPPGPSRRAQGEPAPGGGSAVACFRLGPKQAGNRDSRTRSERLTPPGRSCCDRRLSLLRSYNINKLAEQAVEEILSAGKCGSAASRPPSPTHRRVSAGRSQAGAQLPLDQGFVEKGEVPLWRTQLETRVSPVCVCVCAQ